ncbi:MAG: hypothetical protein GKR87_04120 [Kiritimatiellae bacterium]|nr:hypothetical protein [Kiritimatiellia bacterium]
MHEGSEEKPTESVEENTIFSSLEEQILDSLEKAPAAAILLAWSSVETAIASAVSRLAISPESPSLRSPLHNIDMLSKYGELPKNNVVLLHDMRNLKNKTSHHQGTLMSISQDDAASYVNPGSVS